MTEVSSIEGARERRDRVREREDKRQERAEQIIGYRDLFAWLEERPGLPLPAGLSTTPIGALLERGIENTTHLYAFAWSREDLAAAAREFDRAEKYADESWYGIARVFAGGVTYAVMASRESVCERVKIGTRKVERVKYSEAPTETVEEEVFEWRCPDTLLGHQAS